MKKLFCASLILLLSACGGGGGTGTGTEFTDSYGTDYHSSGYGFGDSGMDGSAGDGAPIVGGAVTITDSTGQTVTATTDQNGLYHAKVNGLVPPFLVQVVNPATNVVRYSLGTASPVANRFIVVNVSSITSKIASDIAVAAGLLDASKIDVSFLSSNTAAGLSSSISGAIATLQTQLGAVIIAAGLSPSTFDPMTFAFIPNHTGYDFVLDNVSLTTATQLDIVPAFLGTEACPFTGTFTGNTAGADTGTFSLTVDAACYLALQVTTSAGDLLIGSVQISNTTGLLAVTASSTQGNSATFNGSLLNHTISGTWANAGVGGTFSGSYVPPLQ
jgi:hypothetical protein